MRTFVVSVAIVGLMTGTAGEASARPRTLRTVQLITAESASQTSAPQAAKTADPARERAPVAGEVAERFRVHDLSRRWVEHQMSASFSAESVPAGSGEETVAYEGVMQELPAPASLATPIPLWMRGGYESAMPSSRYVPSCSLPDYRPTGFLRADAEFRRASFYDKMSRVACEYGIPVGLFDAMIIRESRYRPDIYSPKNAFGLTQLMPGTAAALGVDRYNIEQNLRGGAKYLRQQLDRFGQYHLALAAYNAGPGRVRNGRVPQIAETLAYVDNVLFNWSRLSGTEGRTSSRLSFAEPARSAPSFVRTARVSTF